MGAMELAGGGGSNLGQADCITTEPGTMALWEDLPEQCGEVKTGWKILLP